MDSPYQNFIVIDVETGGLPSKIKKAVFDIALTEIALVVVSKELEIIDQYSWLIKPYKEGLVYSQEAAVTSGITKEMVEEQGEDLKEVCMKVIDVFKKYKVGTKLPVLLGHNFIKFDSEFMLNMFEFCKFDLMKYVNPEPEDTIKWSRLAWVESVNYKLGTCCENANITLQDAHRALSDTIATAKLWIEFMKRLRGMSTSCNDQSEVKNTYRVKFEL